GRPARPLDRRRDGARVRLHQRLPRHRQRCRDVDLDPGDAAAHGGDAGRGAQLRRRLRLPGGGGHRREGHRRGRPGHAAHRLRGPDRRDRLEPGHLVVRPPVLLLARPDRRAGRRRAGRRGGARGDRGRPGREGRHSRAARAAARLRSRRGGDPRRLRDRRPPAPRSGGARLPARSDPLRRPLLARARHQRRAEDDGHHLPRPDRGGRGRRRLRRPLLGRLLGRDGHRARHLRRWRADHQDDGHPHHQDGPGAGLRRPGLGRRRHLLGLGRRLPALDDARDLRRDHGRRRRQARVGGALGRGGQHPARLGAHPPGRRRRRGRHLRGGRGARRRWAGPGGGLDLPDRVPRRRLRAALPRRAAERRAGGRGV
ncbi:MAG: Probable low-affinity inorganic phosphate transporter, partial [uncultured Solirubrobacteraceae bacterium]